MSQWDEYKYFDLQRELGHDGKGRNSMQMKELKKKKKK